jgi:hypothetical protein
MSTPQNYGVYNLNVQKLILPNFKRWNKTCFFFCTFFLESESARVIFPRLQIFHTVQQVIFDML